MIKNDRWIREQAALRELTEAVMAQFFGNDTNLSKRLIAATNEAQLLLMMQPPNDDLANHPAKAKPATSNDITPGPFSEHSLREAWNQQADQFNQWDSLDPCEQLAWAQTQAIAADRARRPTPPAVRELADLAGCVEAWAARLDEGTPEERLLRRVAYVLRQRQAPPHEGEVDALIKILSRIAGMLDFMPGGPPDGLVIHRAIELLRQLTPAKPGRVERLPDGKPCPTPPAEGEVGEQVAELRRRGHSHPSTDQARLFLRDMLTP